MANVAPGLLETPNCLIALVKSALYNPSLFVLSLSGMPVCLPPLQSCTKATLILHYRAAAVDRDLVNKFYVVSYMSKLNQGLCSICACFPDSTVSFLSMAELWNRDLRAMAKVMDNMTGLVNHRGNAILSISIVCGVIQTFAVALRFLARRRIKTRLQIADCFIFASPWPNYVMIVLGGFCEYNPVDI